VTAIYALEDNVYKSTAQFLMLKIRTIDIIYGRYGYNGLLQAIKYTYLNFTNTTLFSV
jgi:hypothetical protein